MSMSSIHHISLPTDTYLLARKKKKIFSSTRRGHTRLHTAGADTLFAADSVCFSCLMELSVPRAQAEYCGQPQSINDLRVAF